MSFNVKQLEFLKSKLLIIEHQLKNFRLLRHFEYVSKTLIKFSFGSDNFLLILLFQVCFTTFSEVFVVIFHD